jgi:hypothetical protein
MMVMEINISAIETFCRETSSCNETQHWLRKTGQITLHDKASSSVSIGLQPATGL